MVRFPHGASFVISGKVLALLFFLQPSCTVSQTVDGELWASVEAEKKLGSEFKLELEQEIRLKDNLSNFKETFSEVSLKYRLSKNLRFSGDYRLIVYGDEVGIRISTGASYELNVGPLSPAYRLKFQRESEPEKDLEQRLRNRLTLGYRPSDRRSPYVEGEVFHDTDNPTLEFVKYRLTLGVKNRVTEANSLDIFYRFQKEVTDPDPKTWNILGIGYEVEF